jgi:cell division protein FtsB
MNRRNSRSRFRTIVGSPITLVLAILLLVLLGRGAYNIHAKAAESARKLADAETNLAKLETNRTNIQSRIAELSTDAGVEASIREKYHAVAPGESVAVIIDTDADQQRGGSAMAAAHASSTESDAGLSWWQRFWRTVRGE